MHQKHTKLTRPTLGNFGRNELGFVGAPCGLIQKLASTISQALGDQYKLAYIDADHASGETETTDEFVDSKQFLTYTDKINYHQLNNHTAHDRFHFLKMFNETDLVLVNANHFETKQQVVIVHPKKEKSLIKRAAQLTDVRLILLADDFDKVPDFVKNIIPEWNKIPVLKSNATDQIIDFFAAQIQSSIPPLKGLVLAGGKSQRMGRNKAHIDYHGQSQEQHVFTLLDNFCESVYLSVSEEQENKLPQLVDTFKGLGPFGAICSAFRENPNAAWLVVAVDLPLLDQNTISQLVDNRNPSKQATAFQSPNNEFPEPLITIWEPKSYPALLHFLTLGYSCPRKVLINTDIHIITAHQPEALKNVNTPEQYQEVIKQINERDLQA